MPNCTLYFRAKAETLDLAALQIGATLGIRFEKDVTGDFEEFDAYSCETLGMRIALLDIDNPALPDIDNPDLVDRPLVDRPLSASGLECQLIIRSSIPYPFAVGEEYINMSDHIKRCLDSGGCIAEWHS